MRVVLVVVLVVTWENKVNSFSDQLKLGRVCKFGMEFDEVIVCDYCVCNIPRVVLLCVVL